VVLLKFVVAIVCFEPLMLCGQNPNNLVEMNKKNNIPLILEKAVSPDLMGKCKIRCKLVN
jgi:hypothetical protein